MHQINIQAAHEFKLLLGLDPLGDNARRNGASQPQHLVQHRKLWLVVHNQLDQKAI